MAFAPQNVILQTGNGQNLVSWDIVLGAISYEIYRSVDGVNFVIQGTSVVNYFIDSSVTVGVQYYYQVIATTLIGNSASSSSYPLSITPCYPGQINLGYLRYMSQLKADKLNSQYLTTDEWNFNINQSTNELYDILVEKYGDDYFFAPPLFLNLTGAQFYPIPDGSNYPVGGVNSPALYKLNGIDANVAGQSTGVNAGWVPLARANWSDRDRYTTFPGQAGALNNIYAMSYRQMGSNLFIFPPNVNMVCRLWYVPILQQMLLDTDMLPFSISGWSEYVIVDSAMKAMLKEESTEKWEMLSRMKSALLERIATTAANRDVGQPNAVSNFRAVMGDPGFSIWGNGYGGGSGFGGGGGY